MYPSKMIGYNRQLTSHFDTSTLHLPQLDGYVQMLQSLCSFPLDPELRALLKYAHPAAITLLRNYHCLVLSTFYYFKNPEH